MAWRKVVTGPELLVDAEDSLAAVGRNLEECVGGYEKLASGRKLPSVSRMRGGCPPPRGR